MKYKQLFEIAMDNMKAQSHNINIDCPVYSAFATSKEEAIGKMILSDWEYNHLPVLSVKEIEIV